MTFPDACNAAHQLLETNLAPERRDRVAVVSAPYADLFQRLQLEIDTLQQVVVAGAEGLDAPLAAVEPVLGLTQDDVVLPSAKLYFAYGLGNALTFPMAEGATSVLLEGPPTPQAVTDLLRDHQVTVFYGDSPRYGMLLARPERLPPPDGPLRCCVSAGEALPPELLRRRQEGTGVDTLEAERIALVRERLAPYKRPRWVTFVDALPKTATGRIQRFQLR